MQFSKKVSHNYVNVSIAINTRATRFAVEREHRRNAAPIASDFNFFSYISDICKGCYDNADWAVESRVCNLSWYGNCSDTEVTSSPTTTPCIPTISMCEIMYTLFKVTKYYTVLRVPLSFPLHLLIAKDICCTIGGVILKWIRNVIS